MISEDPGKLFMQIYNNLSLSSQNNGIGNLGEKRLHFALKYFYEPDDFFHEIKINKYVADIEKDGFITEIQTGNIFKLKEKIDYYASNGYRTKIVIPVYSNIKIVNMNTEGGVINTRNSPQRYDLFSFSKDLNYIKHNNIKGYLDIDFVYFDIEEYRTITTSQSGRRSRIIKKDRIPLKLTDIIHTGTIDDYESFIPFGLPYYFSAVEFSECANTSRSNASYTLTFLKNLGKLDYYGKKGSMSLYKEVGVNIIQQ